MELKDWEACIVAAVKGQANKQGVPFGIRCQDRLVRFIRRTSRRFAPGVRAEAREMAMHPMPGERGAR